jgi:hypothetical protein
MIVRFVKIDKRIREFFNELVFRYSHTFDPILSEIEIYTMHEGRSTAMKDGDQTWSDPLVEGSAQYEIKAEDHKTFNFEAFDRFAQSLGSQFLDTKKRNLFEVMHRATTRSGNVVGGGGKPLDHDTIFEALELIQIDFDENGQPDMPSMVVHPSMAPRLQKLSKEAEEDPRIKARHAEIMRKKKEQFLAREADRKLVG